MRAILRRIGYRRLAAAGSAVGLSVLLVVSWSPVATSQQGGTGMSQPTAVANELLVKFATGISRANAEEILQRAGAQMIGAPALDGRLFHVRVPDVSAVSAVKAKLESVSGVEYVEPVQTVTIQPKN